MGRALLLLTSGLLIIYGIVFKSVNDRQMSSGIVTRSTDYVNNMQARNMTASLVDLALREIDKNQAEEDPWNDGWGGEFIRTSYLGGDTVQVKGYDQTMTGLSTYPSDNNVSNFGGWNQYRVLLDGQTRMKDGKLIKTEVLMQQDSFSKYSYFTDYEPSYIYFFDKDTLTGPVHTNGTFHINGKPTFNGFVSSPNDWWGIGGSSGDRHGYSSNDPQFNGGKNLSSGTKALPNQGGEQTAKLAQVALTKNLRFENEIRVEMGVSSGNGEITIWEKTGSDWSTATEHTISESQYNEGVISSTQRIEIEGTLKGQLTVHSESQIDIMGDLFYNTDPTVDSTSTDLLGIVSEGDVQLDRYAHSANGSQDVHLQASIMALNSSFYVEDYSSGSSRGQIFLHGGLIQKERGAVGTSSGGEVASGFSKNYVYDTRLKTSIPPHFPRESEFSIVYWRDKSNITTY